MSVYKSHLPDAFPWLAVAEPKYVRRLIRLLLSERRTDVPQGSSFAVTVDNWDGTWNLWLSDVSKTFLNLPNELVQRTREPVDYGE